jgi:hypothetical protein
VITSGGNRNPANADRRRMDGRLEVDAPAQLPQPTPVATEVAPPLRLAAAFTELALAM